MHQTHPTQPRPLLRAREDGVLEPINTRAQLVKPGLFRVVAGAADVVLLRRVDSEEDDGGTVLLAGELRRGGALADPISAIVRAGFSGELIISEGATRRSLFIGSASIVGAATNALSERIGAVMTRMGVLDPDQLRVVVSKLTPGKRFGEVAIDEGFLTRERLFEVVRQQAEDIVVGSIAVSDGSFAFLEGFDATRIAARCHLDARDAANKALARLAESSGVAVEARSLEEPIEKFNHAIKTIFRAVAMEGRAGALRASLDAYAADSPIDRAVFAVGRVAPDGRIEAAGVADTLASLGVRDPRGTIEKRLHEYLVYALFVASADLPKDAERAMLADVEAAMGGLTPRPPPLRSIPPASAITLAAPVKPAEPVIAIPMMAVPVIDRPRPSPASPAATMPIARKRSYLPAVIVLLAAVAFGVAFAVTRYPLTETVTRQPTVAPLVPSVSAAPTPAPSATPSVSVTAAPPSSVGTIRAADSGGHRVWIDGKLVGDTPKSYEVLCGNHVVRVGSGGQPQMVEVPCGGEVQVELH